MFKRRNHIKFRRSRLKIAILYRYFFGKKGSKSSKNVYFPSKSKNNKVFCYRNVNKMYFYNKNNWNSYIPNNKKENIFQLKLCSNNYYWKNVKNYLYYIVTNSIKRREKWTKEKGFA